MSLTLTAQQLLPDVEAASKGDTQAYIRLINRCRNSVCSIALAIVKDLDASEDIAQQVFIHIWQQLGSLQQAASFLPWVRQITRYRAYNYLRDNKIAAQISGEEAEQVLEQIASEAELSDDLARSQQNLIVQQFIDQLPEESREIVLLFYREEQNSQQVAELLGISESNVRKKMQRVRELLKTQILAKYGQLVLTTAPGLGLTSLITSALLVSSPPVSAASASALAANSSGLAKLGWLFSGAMLGALGGVLAVILGMKQPLKNAESANERQQLLKLRNISIVWVLLAGILLTLAYEFTAGAVAPIAAFTLFIAGLAYLQLGVWRTIRPRLLAKAQQSEADAKRYRSNLLWCWVGMLGGTAAGFSGLIMGLSSSGRLFW